LDIVDVSLEVFDHCWLDEVFIIKQHNVGSSMVPWESLEAIDEVHFIAATD
jgi:hypothetical protein